MALEMFSGIHEHLWRGIDYLELAIVDFPPQCRFCLHVQAGKGNGLKLVFRTFVNLSSQSCHSERSDLILHQTDQWTNDQDYHIGFGECHSLECQTFAGPRPRTNHHVIVGEETVIYSCLPISDLW